jgi:hypothetical protein
LISVVPLFVKRATYGGIGRGESAHSRASYARNRNVTSGRPALCLLVTLSAIACAATEARATPSADKERASPSNAEITRAVERELDQDPAVPDDEVLVSTSDGIVTLNGTVDNLMAKERALRLADRAWRTNRHRPRSDAAHGPPIGRGAKA